MKTLLWGSVIFGVSFIFHLGVWKVRLPKRQTRALLIIFFGALAAFFVFFRGYASLSLQGCLSVGLFVVSLTLAYIITYSAMEVDSPSLVMVNAIAGAGPEGLPKGRFDEMMTDDVLVIPRIKDLLRDGHVYLEGGRYRLTPKGESFIRIFIFYRKLLRVPLRGG